MPNRYLQQELGLDPMTAEEAQRPPIQFPITPGAWGGQLREDMRREFLPAPGDTEDQQAFKATKLFMMMMGTPKGSPGPGTPGILTAVGRVRPPHAAVNDLREARQMEMSGYHPQEIWDRLGVARGADRFWREEMPGGAADPETLDALRRVLNRTSHGAVNVNLGVVASKEFAATYPELMNKEFGLNKQRPLGLGSGGMDPETGNIFLSPGGALNLPSMFEHEAQHGVQRLHGWNEGGSPMGMSYKDMARLPNETLLRIARFAEKGGENIPQHVAFSAMEDPMFLHYLRLAGETEARNAARRMVDPSLRRQVPSRTEDIPRRFQDVKLPRDFVPPADPYAGSWQGRPPAFVTSKGEFVGNEGDHGITMANRGLKNIPDVLKGGYHYVDSSGYPGHMLVISGKPATLEQAMEAAKHLSKAYPDTTVRLHFDDLMRTLKGDAGHWKSPLYETGRDLLLGPGEKNPNVDMDFRDIIRKNLGPSYTKEWKPDPDQLKQIRRIQKWLQLVEEATKKGK